jgi:hypothetical protein
MMRWLRRLIWLGVLAGGGYGAYRVWQQRQSPPGASPQWPPLETERPAAAAKVAKAEPAEPVPAEPVARWRAPLNGDCPDGYPVKANDNSGIFHVPGGRFYARTVAERCYANAEDAIADGYRPAKA